MAYMHAWRPFWLCICFRQLWRMCVIYGSLTYLKCSNSPKWGLGNNLWPISLITVAYDYNQNLRLSSRIDCLINNSESAFIKIDTTSIMLIKPKKFILDVYSSTKVFTIELDLEKALNTLDWHSFYIFQVQIILGNFRLTPTKIATGPKGVMTHTIYLWWGLQQGNPLFPLLFILAAVYSLTRPPSKTIE